MGIKNYKTNLLETYYSIASKKRPDNIKTLCIDCNGILHIVCNIAKNQSHFMTLLINKLKELIKLFQPSCIAIFTDGQAILAKANTQIKRRNKYLYSKSSTISSLNLTPGTPFMDLVDNTINSYLKKLSIRTYYSSSKVNNEGEIKLFEWLIKNNISDKICVVGSDSDLIVLALSTRPLLDMYIYDDKRYISLFKLVTVLSNLVPNKFSLKWHPVRMDFALISLFQGNDYNDRVADFSKLLEAYVKLQEKKEGFLIKKDGSLNFRVIKKLFEKVNHDNSITCDSQNVYEYFKCIQWNLNLYTGQTVSNFIPKYNNVNIASIIKHMPNYIPKFKMSLKWLNNDVYTLLLMPSVGQKLLPEHLQFLLNDDSEIKDLFPDPCPECIEFKKQISDLTYKLRNASEKEEQKYKTELSKINELYKIHLNEKHPICELPIKRIQDAVNNLIKN